MEKPLEDEINEWLDEYGFQVPYNGTNNFYNDEKIKHARAGIDFIKAKLFEKVAAITKENEKLKELCSEQQDLLTEFGEADQTCFMLIKDAKAEVMRLREERKEYKQRLKEKFIARGFSGNDWNTNIVMDIIDNFKFPEVPNTTLTKEQMRQHEDLSEQREEYD